MGLILRDDREGRWSYWKRTLLSISSTPRRVFDRLPTGRKHLSIAHLLSLSVGVWSGDERSIEQTVDSGPDVGHDFGFYGGTVLTN